MFTVNPWYIIINIAREDYIKDRQNKKTAINLVVALFNIGYIKMTFLHYALKK